MSFFNRSRLLLFKTYNYGKSIYPNLFDYTTSKNAKTSRNLWIILVEKMEKEFLKKRSDQYLHYVETELLKGKTIKDIMSEIKSLEHKLPIKLSQINDRVKQEDYYIDKNKKFVTYINNEINKGRNLDDILAEIRRTVALTMHTDTEKRL